ncbi:hypothetical protein [Geodermatophilus sp. URMC 60]
MSDPAFADRVREMALAGAGATPEEPDALGAGAGRMVSSGRRALADGVVPGSPAAEAPGSCSASSTAGALRPAD